MEQVKKILLIDDPQRFALVRNSQWFLRTGTGEEPFSFSHFVDLASRYTVARLIERDDFQKRLAAGQEVSYLELFYPLMQGYDSVQIAKANGGHCDVELGGTDQTFNLLVGRDLQRSYGQEPQIVITLPLLEGTDGVQKMSKSLGNHIGISEAPDEMFGKLMSIPDSLILKYFTLLTDVEPTSHRNPRDTKADLASAIVTMYHGAEAAAHARVRFSKVFSKREAPEDMPTVALTTGPDGTVSVIELLCSEGLAKTKNAARRLLSQGAVKLNGSTLKQPVLPLSEAAGVLRVGSRHFRRLVFSSGH